MKYGLFEYSPSSKKRQYFIIQNLGSTPQLYTLNVLDTYRIGKLDFSLSAHP